MSGASGRPSAFDLIVGSRRTIIPEGERPAAVGVAAGRIAAVLPYAAVQPDAAGSPRSAERVDLGDVALLPGLVDTHVHVNEPGRTEWEGFATATRAAVAGGVTTIVDMPLNSVPPTVDTEALAAKRAAAAGRCHTDVGFWGGAVPDNLAELRSLHDAGVYGFKCFLSPSGVPEFPPLERSRLRAAMSEIASFDGLLIVHAEDPAALSDPDGPGYAAFLASRPPRAERRAVEQVIALAADTGCRVHILHLSAAECVAPIRRARAEGVRITAETCPHYLTLCAADVPPLGGRSPADAPAGIPAGLPGDVPAAETDAAPRATAFKCCPPIRPAANRDALWEGLASGAIDAVVSDHSPCPPALKAGGFDTAWGGVSSLQLGLAAVWTAARERGHTLADVTRWMAAAPARIAGLADKGGIAVGHDADLIAFAPDDAFTVRAGELHHRHPVTPYAGRTLIGAVRDVWLRGTRVDPARPRGRLLRRDAPRGGAAT